MFLFQTGAIKTLQATLAYLHQTLFLFQTGAIKTDVKPYTLKSQ